MALIYDEEINDRFSVCAIGENSEYFVYLYGTGKRGTVYDSIKVARTDSEALFCEKQAWMQWAVDKIISRGL